MDTDDSVITNRPADDDSGVAGEAVGGGAGAVVGGILGGAVAGPVGAAAGAAIGAAAGAGAADLMKGLPPPPAFGTPAVAI